MFCFWKIKYQIHYRIPFIIFNNYIVCVGMHVYITAWVSSLALQCRKWDSNSDHQARQQTPLPVKPSCQPQEFQLLTASFFFCRYFVFLRQAGMELAVYIRLASTSLRSDCLCIPSAGFKRHIPLHQFQLSVLIPRTILNIIVRFIET